MNCRRNILILCFPVLAIPSSAQINNQDHVRAEVLANGGLSNREYKDSLRNFDLGPLWTQTDNSMVYGFRGCNYQRLRIKILSAVKNADSPYIYRIKGKSMFEGTVSSFSGTIKIVAGYTYNDMHWGVDSEYARKGIRSEGFLIAAYHFMQDSSKANSGIFSGRLTTFWYIDKDDHIQYDDIERYSDGYCNNQFVGIWQQYHSGLWQTCNWGDYRVPFSGDLDAGVGEFSPADQYLKNGWKTYPDASSKEKQAAKPESGKWWK